MGHVVVGLGRIDAAATTRIVRGARSRLGPRIIQASTRPRFGDRPGEFTIDSIPTVQLLLFLRFLAANPDFVDERGVVVTVDQAGEQARLSTREIALTPRGQSACQNRVVAVSPRANPRRRRGVRGTIHVVAAASTRPTQVNTFGGPKYAIRVLLFTVVNYCSACVLSLSLPIFLAQSENQIDFILNALVCWRGGLFCGSRRRRGYGVDFLSDRRSYDADGPWTETVFSRCSVPPRTIPRRGRGVNEPAPHTSQAAAFIIQLDDTPNDESMQVTISDGKMSSADNLESGEKTPVSPQ